MSSNVSEQSLSVAIVFAVADERGCDPLDLPPLYDVIDPDALDTIFERSITRDESAKCTIDFEYAGESVSVRSDGSVTVNGHIA